MLYFNKERGRICRKNDQEHIISKFQEVIAGGEGCRSQAFIMNAAGPKAKPCITLAEMDRELEVNLLNMVWCA